VTAYRLLAMLVSLLLWPCRQIARRVFPSCFPASRPSFVILTYHGVKGHEKAAFERHMDLLRRTYVPVAADFGEEGKRCTHCVAVTFDDAYQNVLTNALPILMEKRIPATIFVPTGFMGGRPGWMKDQNPDRATERVMTEEQLRTLPADLFTIGSHSCSHTRLTGLTSGEIEEDLGNSKERLEKVLGREVCMLAYPYDDWDDRLIRISRKLGFTRVFANAAVNRSTETGGYLYSRTQVSMDDGDLEVRLKMRGAYWWLAYAIAFKHRLEGSTGARPRSN